MHSLTICFGPTGTIWTLLFKEEERAKSVFALLVGADGGALATVDDFGQQVLIRPEEVRGMLLDDMDLSQAAYIERGLHQARSQAKAQQRAMADPAIRSAAMGQGPAVMSPVPGGRFNG